MYQFIAPSDVCNSTALQNIVIEWTVFFLIAWRPSSVCLSVNFSHFHLLLHLAQPNLAQIILWMKGFQVCSTEGPCSFPRGDNYEIVKIHWRKLKIFCRTAWPISTKLGTKHPFVKWIHVCTNEGPRPFPRKDNNEIAKIHWWNLIKSSSQEPLGQFQANLA